jgi:flagellar biosynthetic protein FliO
VAKGKLKIVMILTALILAGGLLSAFKRATAAPNPQQQNISAQPESEQTQENNSGLQSGTNLAVRETADPVGREFYYKMLLSVSIVIALGVGAVYVSKKLLPRISNLPGKQIRVVETAYIAPRKGIHLIQVGTRRLLVASTSENITMLADVTESAMDFAATLQARS